MQSELNYIPSQIGEYHQNEQQVWSPYSNTNEFPSDISLEDLFGESSVTYNGEPTGSVMSGDFFFNFIDAQSSIPMDEFNYPHIHKSNTTPHHHYSDNSSSNVSFAPSGASFCSSSSTSIYSPPFNSYQSSSSVSSSSKRFQKSLSFECSGSSPDEFFCTSDTDSGIHSPGVTRSPPDDAVRWGRNVDNHTFETYFQRPSHFHGPIANQEVKSSNPPFSGQDTQLLNMDDQKRYSAFPLRRATSINDPSLSLGNHGYERCAETIKIEYSALNDTGPMTLCAEETPTSGTFQIPTSSQSCLSASSTQRRLKKSLKRRTRPKKSRKAEKGKSSPHLWEFIRDIVLDPKYNPSLIKWEDKESGVFRFVQSDKVALMWGKEKQNAKMTYEKLSRAMRYYYNRGILERVDGRRLVYKFGPTSHGWKNCPKTSIKLENIASESAFPVSNSVDCETSSNVLTSKERIVTNVPKSSETSATGFTSLPSANVLLGKNLRFATA